MSLRRKLLVVLLLTAVVPMLAVRAMQAVSIFNLQERVGADMRERLTNEAEQDMQRTVEGFAQSLEQQAKTIFALVQVQASEAERRLNDPAPDDPPPVPTDREFARLAEQDPLALQVVTSEVHAIVNEDNRFEPLTVSYATQVVVPPRNGRPGGGRRPMNETQAQRARDDVAKLADMTGVYKRVYLQADDVILWQYTALESGAHFSFPGKAAFPAGYAPRQRLWYRQAIAADRPIGTRPFIDAATRQLIITFAQPIRDPRGNALGVTAIDLPVSRLLDTSALNTDWSDQARVIVVAGYPSRIAGSDGPEPESFAGADRSFPPDVYVLADVDSEPRQGRRAVEIDTLGFDHDADRGAVADDLLAARGGVRRVSIDGEDRMIAYGRLSGEGERPVFALIIAPTAVILEPTEAAIAEVSDELRESLVTTLGLLIALLIIVGVVAWVLSFRLTRPIVELAHASRRVAGGSLDAQVDFVRQDELGELARAFNEMVPALRDRMQIRESLHVAMQVQQSLLPAAAPAVPGLDIAGHSEYCDETGGDYYDFIELDKLGPDTLAIAVGDVTGHGIAAALLMATGRALIRSHANTTGSLGEVFTAVNRQLCDSEFTGRFMTLMYLIVQNRCDEHGCVPIRYLSAGHDPVIVYRPAEDTFIELAGHDIPLGIDADWQFNEETSQALRPGDVLVVGTDGIWECFNADGEQFGKDRLRDTIRAASTGPSESIAQAISAACQQWRGDREQNDDITLVVVKLDG